MAIVVNTLPACISFSEKFTDSVMLREGRLNKGLPQLNLANFILIRPTG
jgi:hypothetical protein